MVLLQKIEFPVWKYEKNYILVLNNPSRWTLILRNFESIKNLVDSTWLQNWKKNENFCEINQSKLDQMTVDY